MGKEERISSLLGTNSAAAAASTRFFSILPQPHPNTADDEDLELSENDVVWSPVSTIILQSQASLPSEPEESFSSISIPEKLVSEISVSSPSYVDRTARNYPNKNRSFHHERFGLPAVLAEEPKSLSPTISAIKAVPSLFRFSTGVDSSVVKSGSGRLYQMSAPVNVPVWPTKGKKGFDGNGGRLNDEVDYEGFEDEKGSEEEEMVPPHIMVARSHRTKFSVLEGVGRTLKGRDLRRVRNAVLQKTGFLD